MKSWRGFILVIPVLIIVAIQLFPVVVVGLASFKTPLALMSEGGLFSASGFFLGNYIRVIQTDGFLHYMWTSTQIALLSTFLSVLAGSLAAYGLTHLRFAGARLFSHSVLVSRMMPPVAIALPIFLLLRQLRAVDSVSGLVIAHTTMNLPFAIWLMLPFFRGISKDFIQAAQMDGCSHWQAFRIIVLPLTLPGLLVTALFCFLLSWNDFLFSLILAGSETKTAPLVVNAYMTSDRIEWGAMTASSVLIMLPVLIFSLALQKHLVSGMSAGGVKG